MKATKLQKMLMSMPYEEFPDDIDFPATTKEKVSPSSCRPYSRTYHNYAYLAEARSDLLIVTVYKHDGRMKWRLFQHPSSFFTKIAGRENPSEATLKHLDDWWEYNRFLPLRDADQVVAEYLREYSITGFRYDDRYNEEDVWKRLKGYQLYLREDKTMRRHEVIRRSISDEMLEITEGLPKKAQDWLPQGPFKGGRYIVYTYRKGQERMEGVCSHCGRTVQVRKPRHNQGGVCPKCHSKVLFISSGKFRAFTNDTYFAYFQPLDSGYCIRVFSAHQSVEPDDIHTINTAISFRESARAFMDNDHRCRKRFDWDNFQNTGTLEWCRAEPRCSFRDMHIYPDTLARVAERYQELRYIPIRDIARYSGKLDPHTILTAPIQYPWIEYLAKLKLYRLVSAVINNTVHTSRWDKVINAEGCNLREILGVGKEAIPILQKLEADVDDLRLYQEITKKQGHVDSEAVRCIRWLGENTYDPTDILAVLHTECAGHISRYVRYLLEQEELEWKRVHAGGGNYYIASGWNRPRTKREARAVIYRGILQDWRDYLAECALLEYDLTNSRFAFPENLSDAHRKTSALLEVRRNEATENAIRKRVPKLNRQYRYSHAGLLIRPPLGMEELITEGKLLNHCVANYSDRHAKGTTTILFIRREAEPDTPYFTMEVKGDKVIQCRGLRNCAMSKEVDAFVRKWKQEKLVSKVTKRKDSVRIAG